MTSHTPHPRFTRISSIINHQFSPQFLDISDNSHLHASHNEEALHGGTHFTLSIKSHAFNGKTRIQAHRMIMNALADEFSSGLHALNIHIKT